MRENDNIFIILSLSPPLSKNIIFSLSHFKIIFKVINVVNKIFLTFNKT